MALKKDAAAICARQHGQVLSRDNCVLAPGHRYLGTDLKLPSLAVIEQRDDARNCLLFTVSFDGMEKLI